MKTFDTERTQFRMSGINAIDEQPVCGTPLARMYKFSALITLLLGAVLFASCKPKEIEYSPMQNGFGVVVHGIGIDSGPDAKLYYKGTNETPVLVWPSIGTHGYPLLYTNDIVFLIADKPDEQGIGVSAMIVVQGTGPAMDITEDILKIAAEQAHVDFKKALRVCSPLRLNQVKAMMKVYYLADRRGEYINMPDLEAQITWEQVFAIMEDVKKTGKTNKVVNSDALYLQKDYSDAIKTP